MGYGPSRLSVVIVGNEGLNSAVGLSWAGGPLEAMSLYWSVVATQVRRAGSCWALFMVVWLGPGLERASTKPSGAGLPYCNACLSSLRLLAWSTSQCLTSLMPPYGYVPARWTAVWGELWSGLAAIDALALRDSGDFILFFPTFNFLLYIRTTSITNLTTECFRAQP
ncbi:hypothetical protein NDU88_004621 [Pleurodeles waltl]|uniref:Uncharacterized protein n=1 Tax=Pleurodeles waltl TaxID=8319 RepID=A0AAV7NMS7_PLEWA|nr:hypothetical protein NDU88_004621 [Pleurodeles waltl]